MERQQSVNIRCHVLGEFIDDASSDAAKFHPEGPYQSKNIQSQLTMMNYLEHWLTRKLDRPTLSIKEKRSSRFKFTRPLGPRGQYAVVQFSAEPADTFAFETLAEWPHPKCDYTITVLDGILDELFATGVGPVVAKVHFTLEAIEWHEVDSCATAFYHAARGAVREILGVDRFPSNIELPSSKG